MIHWLGPSVASLPFWGRTLAYTSAWTGWAMAMELVIPLFLDSLRSINLLKEQADRPPLLGTGELMLANIMGWASQLVGVGAVLAWYNPTPSSWTTVSSWADLWVYWVPLLFYQVLLNTLWDTWYYFGHRYSHINKWLYRHCHKFHHKPDASLSTLTTGYMDPVDSFINVGVVWAAVAFVGCYMHSYWAYALTIHTYLVVQIGGHTGTRSPRCDLGGWMWLLLTPLMASMACLSNSARPQDHFNHHYNPLCNFSVASTFWDDFFGTAKPYQHPHPIGLMLLDLAWMLGLLAYTQWMVNFPAQLICFGAASLLLLLLPTRLPALLTSPFTWVQRLSLWDSIRRAYRITYAPKGTPGAFEADPSQRYIFCYHPQNIIARGAWYTFAGLGRESPVAALQRCKLAVGRLLMLAPFANYALRCYGCCSASWTELVYQLRSKVPTSVAITPDGFRQGQHLGSYNLVLNKRRGFVRLAHETGAVLVPVLGIGEPSVTFGVHTWGCNLPKAVTPCRVHDIKVVFGTPVVVRPGETVEQTHQRYVAELLALGKAHDVKLTIVE